MFCPNCGNAEQVPETYCRRCGNFLNDFAKRKKQFSLGGETPHEQIRTNLVLNAMSAVVSIFSALALYVLFWTRGAEFPAVFAIAALLLAVGGWQFSTFLVGLKLRRNLGRGKTTVSENAIHRTNDSAVLPAAETQKILSEADNSEFIQPHVTENTTRTLEKIRRS